MAATGSGSDSSGSRQPGAGPRGRLFVLSGPSGVGKSTVLSRVRSLMPRLWYSVSVTTRARRPGEVDGVNYHFVSHHQFAELVARGQLLEHAHFAGNHYGTPRAEVEQRLAAGQDVLLEIDVQGALQVRFQYPDALMIFIMPPDEQSLLHRLRERDRDTEEAIEKRYRGAKREIWMAKGSRAFDDMVINDSVDRAVDEIGRLIRQKKSPNGI